MGRRPPPHQRDVLPHASRLPPHASRPTPHASLPTPPPLHPHTPPSLHPPYLSEACNLSEVMHICKPHCTHPYLTAAQFAATRNAVFLVWHLFPIVWALAAADAISVEVEHMGCVPHVHAHGVHRQRQRQPTPSTPAPASYRLALTPFAPCSFACLRSGAQVRCGRHGGQVPTALRVHCLRQ